MHLSFVLAATLCLVSQSPQELLEMVINAQRAYLSQIQTFSCHWIFEKFENKPAGLPAFNGTASYQRRGIEARVVGVKNGEP